MIVDYTWIPIFSGYVAFVMAYGIGANDVANAFATSVGAKAITLNTALIIAAVMEFSGAYFLGSHVTDTVAKGIIDSAVFAEHPEQLMWANCCALLSAAIWLLLATVYSLPVSTTHSIIGGLVGCGLIAGGVDCIKWSEIIKIVISWFTSPVLAGLISAFLYWVVRTLVLRHENNFERSLIFFPVMVAITFAINIFYVIYKGFSATKNMELWLALVWSCGIGLAIGLIIFFILVPILRKRVQKETADKKASEGNASSTKVDIELADVKTEEKKTEKPKEHIQLMGKDVHAELKDEESKVYKIHENSEKFNPQTERTFAFLQVVTATFDSFAHGGNDVANSIGPFAGVLAIYLTHSISSKSEVPTWVLALGGIGIVAGLATLGYKIIASIGVNLVTVTPSRGFAIELGSALVVVTGSRLGLPLSTTHCQVGSTVGVGLLEGKKGVNWSLLVEVFVGWVFTLIIAGCLSAALYAFTMYTPSLTSNTPF
ncbi:hypothetical protein WA158_001133 [Blastocystis sp. Blastoise]